jgi:hypothetical protein
VEESLVVPPEASIAAPAQRFVRTVLANSDVGKDVAGLAVLLTKALINNGILHARSDIAVTVKVLPACIRIEVADENPRHLSPAVVSQDPLSGRDLRGVVRSWGIATISR